MRKKKSLLAIPGGIPDWDIAQRQARYVEERQSVDATAQMIGRAIFNGWPLDYRYRLDRRWSWGKGQHVLWVMLNPSTAGARDNDATLTKCIGFSQRWGFAGLSVVNLYGCTEPDPQRLIRLAKEGYEVVGPENDRHFEVAVAEADQIVVGWGASAAQMPDFDERIEKVLDMLSDRALYSLGATKDMDPCHPVRLAYATKLERWC